MCTLATLAQTVALTGSLAAATETSTATGFGASVTLDAAAGAGSFVAYDKADDPYWASAISLDASWSLDQHLTIAAAASLSWEWTFLVTSCTDATGPRPAGAPARDCSDTNDPNGRRTDLSDIDLQLAYDDLYTFGPLSFSARTSLALPTSRDSRATDNLFTFGLGGRAKLALDPFSAGLGLSFHKLFPTAEASVLEAVEAEARERGGVSVIRCASFRRDTCLLLSGFVPSWRSAIDLEAGFEFPWIEGLSASIGAGYQYSRRYGREPDRHTSPKVDEDGTRIADGINEGDTTSGSIELAYQLDDRLSFAFGVTSQQPARTADNKSLRFPFYDFISPAQNFSAWYLSGTFSL
jgi:hypothetical protein